MQDRYAGDVGDFVKYGLLRAIKGRKSVGVAWYLNPYTDPHGGRHTEYLKQGKHWRHLDPELFDKLAKLVRDDGRSVKAVQRSGVLGKQTVFAAEPLDVYRVPSRDRRHWRRCWFERVRNQLAATDVVFADPDNGLVLDDDFRPEQKKHKSEKRIPLDEVNVLARGRSAVVYHHNSRYRGGHRSEIGDWMGRLPGCTHAYYWRRWSPRTFFVINADEEIERGLRRFAEIWKDNGELVCQGSSAPRDARASLGFVADATAVASGGQPSTRAAERDPVVEASSA